MRHVLLTSRQLEFIEPDLADAYRVLKAWENVTEQDREQVRALICLGHETPAEYLGSLPALGLIACYTTGYDAIDVGEMSRRGISVAHAPGVTAEPVAEFALALILASYRNVVSGMDRLLDGKWTKDAAPLIGKSLSGERIGIVGLGDIGRAVAWRCEALGMLVSWWGHRPKPDAAWPMAPSLEELAREVDILCVCTSANTDNVGMISSEIIDAVGSQGLLVNIARGQLVDEDAMIDALKSGRLGAAAIDVFASEPTDPSKWRGVPNIVCTPHIAGASQSNLPRMTSMLRANLDAYFTDRPLPYPASKAGA